MIVRCTSCVSAFAVDDEKVANRKFAFTCPKCGTENIFDNRKREEKSESEDLFFEDETPGEELREERISAETAAGTEDIFSDEIPPMPDRKERKAQSDEIDFFSDELITGTDNRKKGINLEIEETTGREEILFDDELPVERKSSGIKGMEEDILLDDFTIDETPAEPGKISTAKDEFSGLDDIDSGDEEILFDDEFPAEEKSVKKAAPTEDELLFDDLLPEEAHSEQRKQPQMEDEFPDLDEIAPVEEKTPADAKEELIFDEEDFQVETKPAEPATPEEEILFEEDEFAAPEKPVKKAAAEEEEIFFDDDFLIEEKPAKKTAGDDEIVFNDDFIIDESESTEEKIDIKSEDEFADIGLELEDFEPGTEKSDRDEKVTSQDDVDALFAEIPGVEVAAATAKAPKSDILPGDEITVNLDELDIELEGDIIQSDDDFIAFDEVEEPAEKRKDKSNEPLFDEDITIDMDSLDIDIDDAGDFHKPEKVSSGIKSDDDELILSIDEFEEDLEIKKDINDIKKPGAAKEAKAFSPDDDITLDLDSLDIELDESEEPVTAAKTKPSGDELFIETEEDLKLNLDEMDIALDELEKQELSIEDETIPEKMTKGGKKPVEVAEDEEDESITIDLETLDIEVAESPEVLTGEMSEEDEKITLDDAGLTFSELTGDEKRTEANEPAEEDFSLTLDEIDPELRLEVIGETAPEGEKLLTETIDELPEIDLDEYEAIIREEKIRTEPDSELIEAGPEDFLDLEIPEMQTRRENLDILDYEYEEEAAGDYIPEKGSTTFSIDYSLRYSRLGAVLRLFGFYILSMIPHLILMMVYTVLSGILGFINQIVILSTGRCVEDFSMITENTLRYFLYIDLNILGIVEDRPVYAGRESISHQLQLNITFPVKYSRNLAILRLSIVGIWLITLPHFIILSLLTLAVPFAYLAGILNVIATRRWPNPLFIFLTKYYRYITRLSSFLIGLTDEYPPFRFD